MERKRPRPIVIGVGVDDRRDDGAGLDVARALAVRAGLAADVRAWEGDLAALPDLWDGRPRVVLVDAVRSGAAPGTVHRWSGEHGSPFARSRTVSSHGMSLATVLELARVMDKAPARLEVYGIEAADTSMGAARTPAVLAAVDRLVERLVSELAAPEGPGEGS